MATIAGTLQGRYERRQLLGSGGMGEVYEGYDRLLARRVAIKVLLDPYNRDPVFLTRFEREAQAAARLVHPNIVGVYDVGVQDETRFIVMEHVKGATLRDLLTQRRRLAPVRTIHIAVQVCSALAVAHAHGIVHRDIKPGNIMVDEHDRVKVMDFGLAFGDSWGHITTPSDVLGTAKYISPEHARRDAIDARSDLYSLGVCLYELLTGQAPFEGLIPVAIVYCHVNEEPVPPRELEASIPADLEAVVMHALAKDPGDRYQSAVELMEDLLRVSEGRTPLAAARWPGRAGPEPGPTPGARAEEPAPAAGARTGQHAEPAEPVAGGQPSGERGPVAAARGPEQPRRRGRVRRLAWAATLIAAAVLVGLVWWTATRPRDVPVPDVRGKPVLAAVQALRTSGFAQVRFTPGSARRQGFVAAQQPGPGTRASTQGAVTLTVVGPSPRVRVPAVRGLTPRAAERRLHAAELEVAHATIWQHDAHMPAGRALGTRPRTGTALEAGRAIQLVLSLGPRGGG
ncbi:MAG TPA: Stk1 family PASTA domain-containing Ser/Thr kinase [Actinomycetes bacterium]|nr:Stk1 family PASTA domain-containing Ser/Thr kinase [Actinomycetes bacterium]